MWLPRVPSCSRRTAGCAAVALAVLLLLCALGRGRASADDRGGVHAARDAQRWHKVAQQDQDPRMRLQHMAFARAHFDVARALASDARIERALRVHVRALSRKIDAGLDAAMRDVGMAGGRTPAVERASVAAATAVGRADVGSDRGTVPIALAPGASARVAAAAAGNGQRRSARGSGHAGAAPRRGAADYYGERRYEDDRDNEMS